MRIGTNCFISLEAAIKYYAAYGLDAKEVQSKVDNLAIGIGEPPRLLNAGIGVDRDGRYYHELPPIKEY